LVIGNDGKIHQVYLNIISNAIQAIENKGSITIKTNHRDRNFMVTISDSGIGIASKDLPRVFDAFFTTKLPGSGTGLGLTITYDIIKEVGGSIDITSELGKGTEVVVQLPQHNSNMLS
jgi:signal transduction histidine kinase